MRTGLIVVGACLLGSIIIGVVLKMRYGPELASVQDVMLGLIYFMEQNDGRLPESEAEFRAAPFVEERPDGGVRISAPEQTIFQKQTHGIPIPDLSIYEIQWGTNLTKLIVDDRGKVRDENGKLVELLKWPSSPPSGKAYTLILYADSERIRNAAAAPTSAPTTAPASAPAGASG